MPTATTFRRLLVGLVLAALAVPTGAAGAPQTSDQQRCLNEVNKRGAGVVKDQGKTALDCVKSAGSGKLDKLGEPPQAQTAQACLTNDVRGRIAKALAKLADRDASRCHAEPAQLPDFGYTGAATVGAAATAAALALAADLFGPDLDAAIVSDEDDRDGARCQQEVLKRANGLLDDQWKVALGAKKDALKGKDRLTGTDPKAPVATAAELGAEIVLQVQADARGKIARAAAKLADKIEARCAGALTPIAQMFPGACAASATRAALASCVEQAARRRFYGALAAFDALDVDCDLLDDGIADGTCVAPALARHVLNRIGYGPDAWSLARIQELGVAGYIQEQLSPATIDDAAADAMLAQLPSLTMTFNELRTSYPQGGNPGRVQVLRELQRAKMLRAIASRRQLAEVLVDFWMNHFNVDATSSGRTTWDISPYDRIALRPHVLGTFGALLLANARSPAMGDYLDNRRNRVGEINENYGREVMELHTLGVDGGYTETDVVEVSRCLTGWRWDYDNEVDGFEFRSSWHDQAPKTLFGGALQIPANGGEQDGVTLLAYLASQPATAARISRKLVMRFVNEQPPAGLVAAATTTFLATGGDVRAVLETILLSPEFLQDPANRGTKVKRPHHLLASAARALGVDPAQVGLNDLRRDSSDLGEALYEAPPPTGYPDSSGFWTSPGTIIRRFNLLERRARGLDGFVFDYPPPGATADETVDALIAMLVPGGVSDDTRATAIALVDVLAVPEAERIAQAAAFLLSSPEFLQH